MFRSRAIVPVILILTSEVAVVAIEEPVLAADCPTNYLQIPNQTFTSTNPTFDTTVGDDRVAYDLVAGSARIRQCCTMSGATTDVFDDYDVVGVPPGTPVALTALLTVDGAVWTDGCPGTGCAGLYRAWLMHGADRDSVVHQDNLFTGRVEHHDVLQIPLTIVAGQPERLEIKLRGQRTPGGYHGSEALGVITFAGLPFGVTITSCQGFGEGATPARPISWGRIKTIYR